MERLAANEHSRKASRVALVPPRSNRRSGYIEHPAGVTISPRSPEPLEF